jgi:uroporphyrin-III C-methyltransferase/precorrin-2 dehydrogenase/sirohydrochlorin ferrochelatase
LRAVRALQSADVVMIDDGVAPDVVDFARREARKLLVASAAHGPSRTPDDRCDRAIALAAAGRRVAWLRAGEATTGRDTGATIAAGRAAGVAVEVVPGVSAEAHGTCVARTGRVTRGLDPRVHLSSQQLLCEDDGLPGQARQ